MHLDHLQGEKFMKIYFYTFGCKTNLCETAAMSRIFSERGYEITEDRQSADIFVINSCTVTAESDSKLMQTLRRIKRDFPRTVTLLTGCFPQAFPERAAAEGFPADIVTGNRNRAALPDILNEFLARRQPIHMITPHEKGEPFEDIPGGTASGHTRAFMKIQDGCPGGCTYCIIPKARGNIRSRPMESIVKEARLLAESGYREIVLTGINLAYYGAGCGLRLTDAVKAVAGVEGISRIRLGSLEPELLTEDDIDRLSETEKLCPCFHLSLQSGCGRTLAAMNRRYTPEDYTRLARIIRDRFPQCGMTTDVMTGFPGETEEDHRVSMDFVRSTGFSRIHVFPYSPREGTAACTMPRIPAEVKKRRAAEMTEVGRICSRNFAESLLGLTFPVLFEREGADKFPHGYTPNYTHVKILTKSSEKSLRNSIFYVTIDKVGDESCYGHIVQ